MRLLKYELVKLFARKRTYIGYGAFAVVQLMVLGMLQLPAARQAVARTMENNWLPVELYYGGLTQAVLVIIFTFMLLGALYIALVGGDIVAKEVEDGTMRLVLARPVSRVGLIVTKWLACTIYTITLILFLAATSLIGATLYHGGLGRLFVFAPEQGVIGAFGTAEGFTRYLIATGLLALTTQTISNMALMFSCTPVKPAAATVLTLSVLFVDLVLRGIPYFADYRHFFITHHSGCWIRVFAQPTPTWDIGVSLAFLVGLNVTFVLVGAAVFTARDIKQ